MAVRITNTQQHARGPCLQIINSTQAQPNVVFRLQAHTVCKAVPGPERVLCSAENDNILSGFCLSNITSSAHLTDPSLGGYPGYLVQQVNTLKMTSLPYNTRPARADNHYVLPLPVYHTMPGSYTLTYAYNRAHGIIALQAISNNAPYPPHIPYHTLYDHIPDLDLVPCVLIGGKSSTIRV